MSNSGTYRGSVKKRAHHLETQIVRASSLLKCRSLDCVKSRRSNPPSVVRTCTAWATASMLYETRGCLGPQSLANPRKSGQKPRCARCSALERQPTDGVGGSQLHYDQSSRYRPAIVCKFNLDYTMKPGVIKARHGGAAGQIKPEENGQRVRTSARRPAARAARPRHPPVPRLAHSKKYDCSNEGTSFPVKTGS